MTVVKRVLLAALGAGALGSAAAAQGDVEPAGWPRRKPVCPPAAPPICVPQYPPSLALPPAPAPGTMPAPGQVMPPPGTPPTEPGTPTPPGQPPAAIPPAPATPEAAAPTLPTGSNLLAEAPARGTGSGGSLLPTVNGDLLGGGGIAGPLPVVVAPNGQFVGRLPVIILPNGQRVTLGAGPQLPTDELIRSRGALNTAPPGSTVVGLFPPEGAVFDPSFADAVARIPQIVRGPFKVTENESPRPRTRAYFSYYFYDQAFQNYSNPNVPRVLVHQEVFGYEQAFLGERASVGIRLPYNQLVSTSRFYSDTGLGDITVVGKVILAEDRCTGSLVSGGLVVTPPTAGRPFSSTISGGDRIGGTLIQPYLGYILRRDRAYLQGFTSLVVPTDDRDVTLLTNDMQLGYILYRDEGATVSSVVPTFEAHVNTPLNQRGARRDPVGFVDQVTLLGGTQFLFRDRSAVGVAVGAPITGPRPFSLQATIQFNLWF